MHALFLQLATVSARAGLAIAIVALVMGCSTTPIPGPDAPPDFAEPRDGAESLADLAVSCPNVFPVFDKSCSRDADCFIALHMINCCGDVAIGYDVGAQAAFTAVFTAAEKTCETMYPACGCAAPTKAEDGRTEVQGKIMVRCAMGMCSTYVP